MNAVTTFKKLHDGSRLLHLPNAWDAGSARLFESLGAPSGVVPGGRRRRPVRGRHRQAR